MAVGSGIGDFFARIFVGSLVTMALNFVFFGVSIFLAGKILAMGGNSLQKGFAVSLVVLIASFMPQFFNFVDPFFSTLIMFAVMVAAIKAIYGCDWLNAFLNLILATAIAAIASIAVNPLMVYAIWG
jgi:hypothetical protein